MTTCAASTCERPVKKRIYCDAHYLRWLYGRDMDKPLKVVQRRSEIPTHCQREGCDSPHYSATLCKRHYYRRYSGRPMDVPHQKPPRVAGVSTRKNGSGYIDVYLPDHPACTSNGYVPQHRLFMEQKLGRRLRPGENVHHMNGIRDDNRIENLELWLSAQPGGQRVQDLVAFAREILDRYGDEADRL